MSACFGSKTRLLAFGKAKQTSKAGRLKAAERLAGAPNCLDVGCPGCSKPGGDWQSIHRTTPEQQTRHQADQQPSAPLSTAGNAAVVATPADTHNESASIREPNSRFWTAAPELSELTDPSSSDAEILDTSRIIQSSDRMRSQLSRYLETQGSSDSEIDVNRDGNGSGGGNDPPQIDIEREIPLQALSLTTGLLRWNPQFLGSPLFPPSKEKTKSQRLISSAHAESAGQRVYPLRRRLEKNLHPYTKLVWTNPEELRGAKNKQRDMSALADAFSNGPAQGGAISVQGISRFTQDDSEDGDYIPGSPEARGGAEEEEEEENNNSQYLALDVLSDPFRDSQRRRGTVTYAHALHRYRQRLPSHPRKRRRHGSQHGKGDHGKHPRKRRDSDSLPSVASLLGGRSREHRRSNSRSSSESLDLSGTQHARPGLARKPAPSPFNEPEDFFDRIPSATQQQTRPLSPERTSFASQPLLERQLRLSRGPSTHSQAGIHNGQAPVEPAAGSSSDSSSDLLPTAKARRLRNLTRNQIRGVLPFSFMRDFTQDKRQEIEEEISKWRKSGPRTANKRRVLSSSPSDPEPDDAHFSRYNDDMALVGNSGAMSPRQEDANLVADLFSDLAIPSPTGSAEPRNLLPNDMLSQGAGSMPASRRIQHSFNFVDMYEWQFPPLAPPGTIEQAPSFLRIAARESRRNGVRARSHADNPHKKAIRIEARSKREFEEGDIAQSILASWKLGMIDIRRVYFCDDMDDSDAFENHQVEMEEDDWLGGNSFEAGLGITDVDPIFISDDEAIEDNAIPDVAFRTRSGHRKRSRSVIKARSRHSIRDTKGAWASNGMLEKRRIPGSSYRTAAIKPTTRGLDSVMGEFAAVNSDSESSDDLHSAGYKLPPPLTARHLVDKASERARQQSFIQQFNRQPRPQPSSFSRHGKRPSHSSHRRAYHASNRLPRGTGTRAYGPNAVPGMPGTPRADFLFDEEQRMGPAYQPAGSPRRQQTVLFPGRHVQRAFSHQIHSASAVARPQPAGLDAVVARISRQRPDRMQPSRAARASAGAARTGSRNLHRKQVPTRVVNPIHAARMAVALATSTSEHGSHQRSGIQATSISDADSSDPPLFGGGLDALHHLPSGTRFSSDMWISQGGIKRVERMMLRSFYLASQPANPAKILSKVHADTADPTTYQFNDALSIDTTATAAEFVQAYSTLIVLWHESLETTEDSAVASVMLWVDFVQKYLQSIASSNPALSLVAQKVAVSIHDALPKLDRLVDNDKRNVPLASAVCFSFIITLSHLAVVFSGRRSAVGSLGPAAVGEDEDLDSQWTSHRFRSEIDNCMLVLVRFLCSETPLPHVSRLGTTKEIWVALIHMFPGLACGNADPADASDKRQQVRQQEAMAQRDHLESGASEGGSLVGLVPVTGVWAAVHRICTLGAKANRRLAANAWSAFFYLLPLSQLNTDGVAAPRVPTRCHEPLAHLLEAAVETQLLGGDRHDETQKTRRPSEEVAIRQAFFRVHSTVVTQGITIAINSPLHVQLYRYLENRKFRSLAIEPPPSLPRFFTRYSGSIAHASSPSDTCTILWLKSLDVSMGGWVARLGLSIQGSKQHRRMLRDVRSIVSKLLPTRLLTFDGSSEQTHLSTLANYYAVFLFFLHAVPSDIVRSVRLYTQFQALLKFRESVNLTARRVYFEAWSAAVTILLLNLRKLLESRGDMDSISRRLLCKEPAAAADMDAVNIPAAISDYYSAMVMAVGGWSESLGVIMSECDQDERVHKSTNGRLWELLDTALMYLNRVLSGAALAHHPPTVLLLVHAVFRSPHVLRLTVYDGNTPTSMHVSVLRRLLATLKTRQDVVSGRPRLSDTGTGDEPAGDSKPGSTYRHGQTSSAGGDDSQLDMAMFDSNDLLVAAEEAEEQERLASFAVIDAEVVGLFHEQYIPEMRRQIVSRFTSISGASKGWGHKRRFKDLEASVEVLVYMVSACVDAGLRTWDSFLDEYGRDSLHLIPDRFGRRVVLVLFAVSMGDLLRSKAQSMQHVEHAVKDIWFSSVCDLRVTLYVHRLAAQLRWLDGHAESTNSESAVFAGLPVDKRLLDSKGLLRDDPVFEERASEMDYGERASLVVSFIDYVLQAMPRSLRAEAAVPGPNGPKQIFSAWVTRLLDTQRELQGESSRSVHGLADIRPLVDAMAERVTLLARDNCAELLLPPNLAFQQQ
ncbi:hypothetical protein GQ54DRAFT_337971 [Martensiomyces pterosporus]|nr:hypothetical protein GQ54DRAFT_337971 [Martensiomyces pterosporus]